ncbi:hypothetical protein Slin15195_G125800 [Septoria linicola]|uniref:Uncharacterized protein n=1 Tax=Septoria linicola TaxID=215465 RepID=A0A9Q9BAA4_9PEZI|nr:hypothetical protein Slin14017_G081980 [Septoria linicola]USW59261.1 hypothetical protein Slin15195_G125800 [Septoria linicola]
MSSNPFRRSRVPVEPDPASANIFHGARAAADLAAASTPPGKTQTKRVVIQSPPLSPGELYSAQNAEGRIPSVDTTASAPQTLGLAGVSIEGSESCSEGGSEGVRRADPYLHASSSKIANGAGELPSTYGREGAVRAPYNPFARTLATQQAGSSPLSEGLASDGHDQNVKPALDVDAFKDILLRGAPVPAGLSTTRSQDINGHRVNPSSQYDSAYGLQPESPRDAHHDYESASDEDDNERSGLIGVGRSDDLAPPAPPKPKVKGPQTVSFADFDQSIPPGFMAPGPKPSSIHPQHVTGILRAASPRPGSDLNKPLPPPPQGTTATPPPSAPDKNTPPPELNTIEPPTAAGPKIVPPPPPPTRKSGTGHGRARSSSNLSNMTQDSTLLSAADNATSASSNKLAPPPPPTRKSQGTSQPPQSQKQQDTKQLPPPPPLRRHHSKSGGGSSNISRQASDDSTTAPRPMSVIASGAPAPPPPPPRRAHGSKRTSLDGAPSAFPRRLSGEHYRGTSFDSERSASISSLQKVAETSESNEQAVASPGPDQSRDILAEMSAFQAELDALARASSKDK